MKSDLNQREWDGRCRRCGRCCYEKIEHEGQVYYTDTPCERLDLETNTCTVYNERHVVKPECAPLTRDVLCAGILPADCPYVADLKDYTPPQLWDENET